jgi:hypothetical protein
MYNGVKLQIVLHYTYTFRTKIWGLTRDRFLSQRCHLHHCDENWRFRSWFSLQNRSHIQKGFNLWITGLWEVNLWKNQRSKISCQGPFKGTFSRYRDERQCSEKSVEFITAYWIIILINLSLMTIDFASLNDSRWTIRIFGCWEKVGHTWDKTNF